MGTSVPQKRATSRAASYVDTGRTAQKSRTRAALVDAARRLLADGQDVSVESAALAAGVSRTTAYRYFPHRRELVAAAHPQIEAATLLPTPAPTDPEERLAAVLDAFLRDVTVAWEPALRAALRQSLEPGRRSDDAEGDGPGRLRQGRAVGWFEEALAPLRASHPRVDVHRLAMAIRSVAGIESLVWLVDVGGLTREEAVAVMSGSAQALLASALRGAATTPAPRRPRPPRRR